MSGTEVDFPRPAVEHRPDGVLIVNDSDAPDGEVLQAVYEHMTDTSFVESAGLTPPPLSSFQMYASDGNVLQRSHWSAPRNVIEEIRLARDLAHTDDAISGAIGELLAAAFKGRMRHLHEDEKTEVLFDKLAEKARLDSVFKELYLELLIASSVTTVTGFTTEQLTFNLDGVDRRISQNVVGPRIGIMPAEHVRVKGSDIMGLGQLCYKPSSWEEEEFLAEYFNERTAEARKRVMRQENPFLLQLLTGRVVEDSDTTGPFADVLGTMNYVYTFNPRLVHRTTFAKGAAKYPRPLLTANFALLEAKRLLNILDYSLLQGAANYIVVAKKGTDQRPARPNEIAQLAKTVKMAGKSGVIVGDHRLSIEVLTPNVEALLQPERRDMVDRKLKLRMLRLSELPGNNAEDSKNNMEFLQAVVTTDRDMLVRHVENNIYEETVDRNGRTFTQGAPKVWFPPVILAGLDIFLQGILKLRDRGDIPRAYGVEFFGFDMKAAVRERKREKSRGDDRVMLPVNVPHDSPANGSGSSATPGAPNDNGPGRPRGARDAPGVNRGGERITAILDEASNRVTRIGEVTYAILEQHADTKRDTGVRMTANERALLDEGGGDRGGITLIAVNHDHEVAEDRRKLVRLREGVSMVVGRTLHDEAIVAKALIFNRPDFTDLDIVELAVQWGFDIPDPEPAALPPAPEA